MNQLDSLVANYVNSFNKFSNEIESEKNFLSRIRSKINVLEMYSNSSANNITYFADNLNNFDFIDVKKIRSGYLPDVSDGFATLPRKNIKRLTGNIRVANQNYNNQSTKQISFADISNGLKGSFHLYQKDEATSNPYLYEKDNALLRANELAMLDQSPATYFEYEAIRILDGDSFEDYETQYSLSYNGSNQSYIDWASFDTTKPLKLTVELSTNNQAGENINHISIVPFFGYANIDTIKNIKVSSVKFFNEKDNVIKTLIDESNSMFIGSDINAPSLSVKNNYYYNKGVLRFEKVKANKIYITFEQSNFNNVTIKKPIWIPYESSVLARTNNTASSWRGQSRFSPKAIVADDNNYRSEDVSWDKKTIVPFIDRPAEIKSSPNQIVPVRIKYWQQSLSTLNRIKVSLSQSQFCYLSSNRTSVDGFAVRTFSTNAARAEKYQTYSGFLDNLVRNLYEERDTLHLLIDDSQDLSTHINQNKKSIVSAVASSGIATFTTSENHGLAQNDRVFIDASKDSTTEWVISRGSYTVVSTPNNKTFTVSITSGALPQRSLNQTYFIKSTVVPTFENVSVETFQDLADSQKTKDIFLRRNFEYIKSQRAAIGIRDLTVGFESYSDVAEIISKPYAIYGNLDLLSLQVEDFCPVEKDSTGKTIGTSSISYYISVDGGSKWIQISPMEKAFSGIPEVLAFNQNLSTSSALPQIAYFNFPEIPQKINSIVLKAVLRKDRNVNSTPILYSYKLALKVTQ